MLSPEDIALMKQAIAEAEQGEYMGGDEQQDAALIQPLVQAVQFLAEQLEVINDRLAKLEGVVMDDLIGGITGLYTENQRTAGIEGLKSKYSSMFEPHQSALEALYPGLDIYSSLHDHAQTNGLDDAGIEGEVQNALAQLTGKINAIKGAPSQSEEPIDQTETVAAEVPGAPEDQLMATIKSMKGRKNPTSFS